MTVFEIPFVRLLKGAHIDSGGPHLIGDLESMDLSSQAVFRDSQQLCNRGIVHCSSVRRPAQAAYTLHEAPEQCDPSQFCCVLSVHTDFAVDESHSKLNRWLSQAKELEEVECNKYKNRHNAHSSREITM